jgi:hypothetical protein
MKKILKIGVIGLFVLFLSCDKTEKFDANVVTEVKAKVENASEYSNVVEVVMMGYDRNTYRYFELARGDWKDGGFTIELPKTLDPNYLNPLIRGIGAEMTTITTEHSSTVKISNKNVKVINATFWGVDKDGKLVTRFIPDKMDKDGSFKEAIFTYVDSDVTISGRTEREGIFQIDLDDRLGIDIMYIYFNKITTTYSVKWEEGWNVWNLSRSFNQKKKVSVPPAPRESATEKWSTTPVKSLKWHGCEDCLWLINTVRE